MIIEVVLKTQMSDKCNHDTDIIKKVYIIIIYR